MTRGGTIATTFLFSVLILKIKIKPKMIIGSGLAIIGIIFVGISNILYLSQTSSEELVPI